ncbi:MAG: hypothetical protein ACE5HO_00525 [bacterium]
MSINLKSQALVLGPVIRLGDIGILSVPDSVARRRLESVELGKAAPPGESREISIYYIRRSLKRAGLGKFISNIKGPKTIRVTTAPIELDKARLRDGIAKVIISNRLTKKT